MCMSNYQHLIFFTLLNTHIEEFKYVFLTPSRSRWINPRPVLRVTIPQLDCQSLNFMPEIEN